MKEIKFRTWNTETNKMIINVKEMGVFALQSIYSIDEFLVIPTNEKYPLMQYTGLKDKNGVEIYEGDIIKLNGNLYEVWHSGLAFGLIDKNKDFFEYMCQLYDMNGKVYEVIGNVYENSELAN